MKGTTTDMHDFDMHDFGRSYISVSTKPRLKWWKFIESALFIIIGIGYAIEGGSLFSGYHSLIIGLLLVCYGIWNLTQSISFVWETKDIGKDLNTEGVFVLQSLSWEDLINER